MGGGARGGTGRRVGLHSWAARLLVGGLLALAAHAAVRPSTTSSVQDLDADVDSDNNSPSGWPDRDPAEDELEDIWGEPGVLGRLLVVNDSDDDHDGIPDFADGFDWDLQPGSADDTTPTPDGDFAPLVLELPDGFDALTATLCITYDAAYPQHVTRDGEPPAYGLGWAQWGALRLWTAPEGEPRDGFWADPSSTQSYYCDLPCPVPQGGMVFPGYYMAWQLGFSTWQRSIVLFVEATTVRESWLPNEPVAVRAWPGWWWECPGGVRADAVTLGCVRLDLDLDSDNTRAAWELPERSAREDQIEDATGPTYPGKAVRANDADSDGDGVPNFADGYDLDGTPGTPDDRQDPPDPEGGDRFVPLVLELPDPLWQIPGIEQHATLTFAYAASDPAQAAFDPASRTWSPAPGKLRLWRKDALEPRTGSSVADPASPGDFVPAATPISLSALGLAPGNRTIVLYLEGIDRTATDDDRAIEAALDPDGCGPIRTLCRDRVRVAVTRPEVDLDVDSDNNDPAALPDRSAAEDAAEDIADDPARPGRLVMANDDDDDHDGIPDFADGFDADQQPGTADDAAAAENDFVPLILELSEGFDLSAARIRIAYDASPPAPAPDPPAGHLRLWMKPGSVARDPQSARSQTPGDFVEPGDYRPEQLGITAAGQAATLYAEAVRETDDAADTRIEATVDPDGDGPQGFACRDAVRLRAVRMQFVIPAERDESTGLPLPNAEPVPTDFIGVSDPRPTVTLDELSPSAVTIDEAAATATVTLRGVVRDPIADNVPRGKVSEGLADIEFVNVSVNGEPYQEAVPVTARTEGESGFWRQHPYKGAFGPIAVALPIAEGTRTIRVETSENAAGRTGFREVAVTLEKRELPGTGACNGDAWGPAATVNIYLPQDLDPARVDAIQYYRGLRDPQQGDPTLTEQPPPGGGRGEPPTFRGTVNGFEAELTLNGFHGLTSEADTFTARAGYVFGGERVTYILKFTETGPTTRLLRSELADPTPGTLEANLFVPVAPAAEVADALQFYYGPRGPLPDDPVLAEAAGAPGSLRFLGNLGGEPIAVAIEAATFQGFTAEADRFTATIRYGLADGAAMQLTATFTETGPETRLFRAVLADAAGAPGNQSVPPVFAALAACVVEGRSSQPGCLRPFTVRLKGLPATGGHRVALLGAVHELAEDAGWHYPRAASIDIKRLECDEGTGALTLRGQRPADDRPVPEAGIVPAVASATHTAAPLAERACALAHLSLPRALLVANYDSDGDGIPDYADGFGAMPGVPEAGESPGAAFATATLRLAPALDLREALVEISYDASPPSEILAKLADPQAEPAGSLRLWAADAACPRDPSPPAEGGHYLAPGVYTPGQLGLSGNQATLYVEAIKESQAEGDLAVTVRVYPTGNAAPGASPITLCERLTSTRIQLLARNQGETEHFEAGAFALSSVPRPDATITDGDAPGAVQLYRLVIHDPRAGTRAAFVDGQPVPLARQGAAGVSVTDFALLHADDWGAYEANQEYVVAAESGPGNERVLFRTTPQGQLRGARVLHETDGSATIEFNAAATWRNVRPMSPEIHDAVIHRLTDKIVNELERSAWDPIEAGYAPGDTGAFGKEVHKRLAGALATDKRFLADIYVESETKRLLSVGRPPAGVPSDQYTQVDTIGLAKGYRPKVGEALQDGKMLVYEVKTSIQGRVDQQQLRRLRGIAGSGSVRLVRARRVWRPGGWVTPARISNLFKILALYGMAKCAWNAVHAAEFEDEWEEIDKAIAEARKYPDDSSLKYDACRAVWQYFRNFDPTFASDAAFLWNIRRIISEWQTPE